jgi:hypothetical protein
MKNFWLGAGVAVIAVLVVKAIWDEFLRWWFFV